MKKFICILSLLIIGALFASCQTKGSSDVPSIIGPEQIPLMPLTKEEQEFIDSLLPIQKLEEEAKSFIEENELDIKPSLLALQYIRCLRYNTNTWNVVAGVLNQDFVTYLEDNQELVNEILNIDTLHDTITNETLDFVHMMATLNTQVYGNTKTSADLSGWAGDLVQFCSAIKNETESIDDFATNNGSFNKADLIADIDAINIYNIYKAQNNKSIYSAMVEYYKALKDISRNAIFIANFPLDFEDENLNQAIFNRLKNNPYLTVLNRTYNLSFDDDRELFNEVICKFLDYFKE